MSGIEAILMADPNVVFSPTQTVYSTHGTYTVTIPSGASTMTVECWGASGYGGHGVPRGGSQGGGGASGSYCRSVYSVAANNGQTLTAVVGYAASSASTVTNATFSTTVAMSAPVGGNGGLGTFAADGIGGVAGAAATGGTAANLAGNAGQPGGGYGSGTGAGGNGVVGVYGTGTSGGNGTFTIANSPGQDGLIIFNFV